jgi:RNA polymerase sigma factor (sigma-70 family)
MGYRQRAACERAFYQQYNYFIREGCRRFGLSYDDSFSAYSDAVLSAIHNIVNDRYVENASLKTYLFRVFSNKCIDLVRNHSINKQQVNRSVGQPELLDDLPDTARNAIETMMQRYNEQAILDSLEAVGEKCREILLYFEDGYTDKEIAERLAYNSPAVAKTTRHRCLEKMRELMHQFLKKTE